MPTTDELDVRVTALETWRTGTVAPALSQAQTVLQSHAGRLNTVETALLRVRAAWRALVRGELEDVDGDGGVIGRLQPAFTPAEMREIRWLLAERRKVRR